MFAAAAPPYRVLFGVLLISWGLLFISGMIWGRYNEDRSRRLCPVNKLLMSAILVIIAAIWWLVFAMPTRLAPHGGWITCGMFFGLLGDVLLAHVLPLKHPVLLGMLAFGIGHILYMVGYSFLGWQLGLSRTPLPITLGVALAAAVIAWRFTAWNPGQSRAMNIGALVYTILLCSMVGAAAWLALEESRLVWLVTGAALFMLSDLLLARYLFQKDVFPSIRDVVWGLYITGQALIVFSIGTALTMI